MDRRIKKSKKAIENALTHLMAECNFGEITINAIAEKADVNRGTIYLHYKDKYDLLDQSIEKQIQKLVSSCMIAQPDSYLSTEPLLRTFQYIEEHSFYFYTLLNNEGITTFRQKLLVVIQDRMREQLFTNRWNKKMKEEAQIQFYSAAIIGVIEWWIMEAMPCSAKEITKELSTLLERNQIILK